MKDEPVLKKISFFRGVDSSIPSMMVDTKRDKYDKRDKRDKHAKREKRDKRDKRDKRNKRDKRDTWFI